VLLTLVFASAASAASIFYIRGGGNGHGIGMSQYGAYGYALHGKDYQWILAHYYRGTTLSTTSPTQNVRVLLSTGAAAFSGATGAGGKKLKPGVTYTVRPNADGTLALVSPKHKKVGTFTAPLTATGPGPLSLASVGTYHGALEFRPDGAGGVETIDVVALDDYVRGVISAEIPSTWSAAALEAQAVAARTYALTSDAGGSVFGLYADTRSQMYGGVGAETPQTATAVSATRGQIVTYNGAPATTYFFSSSGGHTENVENVWPGATPEPWLRGVPDPYDGAGGDPYHRWSYAMSVPSATSKLASLVKGSLVGIRVTKHGASPRILQAQVVGTRGYMNVSGLQLQRIFKLRTTYAAFTTIATAPGRNRTTARGTHAAPQSQAVAALVPLVDDLAGAITGLHGTVFPARDGATVVIQRRARHGWRTIRRTRTGRGGGYDAPVPGPGTYRIVYQGLYGPAVTVG
jgi:stage II sporulation protein D